jgi:hypothetical protein
MFSMGSCETETPCLNIRDMSGGHRVDKIGGGGLPHADSVHSSYEELQRPGLLDCSIRSISIQSRLRLKFVMAIWVPGNTQGYKLSLWGIPGSYQESSE